MEQPARKGWIVEVKLGSEEATVSILFLNKLHLCWLAAKLPRYTSNYFELCCSCALFFFIPATFLNFSQ